MDEQWLKRRPRWAFPFTILSQADTVRLVAGEDYRYTLVEPGLDTWLPSLLPRLNGQLTLGEILDAAPPPRCASLQAIVERLYGERVLVDGPAAAAHQGCAYQIQVQGQGELRNLLAADLSTLLGEAGPELVVFCQDRLDYAEAQTVGQRCRSGGIPWLWCTIAALQRGYVSPLFLANAGPCFTCLLRHFQRLSPAPEMYDALLDHSRQGGGFEPAPFPRPGVMVLHGLVLAKLAQAAQEEAPPSLYRLHVLELDTMEVSTHRVFADPECPACRERKP